MRKLKLQVQMSVNGFVGGPNGELDWMEWNISDDMKNYIIDLTNSVDTILLGRKMTDEFIKYWTDILENKPDSEDYPFAKQMVDYNKIVFTKTLNKSNWKNTTLAKGNISEEVNNLKKSDGSKDIIVYGGAGFVSSLIKNNLIDEYYFFINPSAIGKGLTIFGGLEKNFNLKLIKSTAFDCGVVVNQYEPK